jgi:nucleotide-binding universal stress UspA family protein
MVKDSLRILVPLDGSAEAESILAAVLPLARLKPVRLTLLGAVPKDTSLRTTESYLAKAERALERKGIEGLTKVCIGDPVTAILRQASPDRADILAMATHGRSGLRRLLMGSVAEEVVRRASIPLIVCRPRSRMEGWIHVVTLDGSSQAEAVLDDLVPLTRLLGATLHLLHVEHQIPIFGTPRKPGQARDADARSYLERLACQTRARAVSTVVTVRRGAPGPEILRYAAEVRAGLVAMATHGRTGLNRAFLGSVAEAVLRKATCPLMLRRVNGLPSPTQAVTVFV